MDSKRVLHFGGKKCACVSRVFTPAVYTGGSSRLPRQCQIYIKNIQYRSLPTSFPNISEIRCAAGTHAYVLNENIIQTGIAPFLEHHWTGSIDYGMMCRHCDPSRIATGKTHGCFKANSKMRVYGIHPMIVFQKFDGTSSSGGSMKIRQARMRTANQKLMRLLGTTSEYIDTTSLVILIGVIGTISITGVISVLIMSLILWSRRGWRYKNLTLK